MNRDFIFYKQATGMGFSEDNQTPSLEYYRQKKQMYQERQLSPWDSEEVKSINRTKAFFDNNRLQNAMSTSLPKRQQRTAALPFQRMRNRATAHELKTSQIKNRNKISQDFLDLVKRKKHKQTPLLCQHHENEDKVPLSRIEMTLTIDESYKKNKKAPDSISFRRRTIQNIREQPVKVKIAKRLFKLNHRENNSTESKLDRNYIYEPSKSFSFDRNSFSRTSNSRQSRFKPYKEHLQDLPALNYEKKAIVSFCGEQAFNCTGQLIKTIPKNSRRYKWINSHNQDDLYFSKKM